MTIKSGVQVYDKSHIEDDVFRPNVTLTNDCTPLQKLYVRIPLLRIKRGASLGANCTILPGITIGRYALIGAGAVATNDVPDYAIIAGNPAKILSTLMKIPFLDLKKINSEMREEILEATIRC